MLELKKVSTEIDERAHICLPCPPGPCHPGVLPPISTNKVPDAPKENSKD